MPISVVITRPAKQARSWSQQLQQQLDHIDCKVILQSLPLIDIAPLQTRYHQHDLQQIWNDLHLYHAAIFVSVPAVEHFFLSDPNLVLRWNTLAIRAWAPGLGTQKALLNAGVHHTLIDSPSADAAQFDSETLWPLLMPQLVQHGRPPLRILHIRGTDQAANLPYNESARSGTGRDWLSQAIADTGAEVNSIAVYRRQIPQWDKAQRHFAQSLAQQRAIWIFSSSLALRNMSVLLPDQPYQHAVAITTHHRIASTAQATGFGQVTVCRPTLFDIAQSIQSCL